MPRYRSRNHEIDARWRLLERATPWKGIAYSTCLVDVAFGQELRAFVPLDRRSLVHLAVRRQLENDNKRPWSLAQKLNDSPYRYTRDTLWAALNGISARLGAEETPVAFGTEGEFKHPKVKTFAEFVNSQLTKNVSSLINGIMEASRWG